MEKLFFDVCMIDIKTLLLSSVLISIMVHYAGIYLEIFYNFTIKVSSGSKHTMIDYGQDG